MNLQLNLYKGFNVFRTPFLVLSVSTLLLACSAAKDPISTLPTAALPDGIELIDQQEHPTADTVAISYSKYKLDNGLTVILHEDHSDPLVHVDMTYHVGSAREEPGKSGFAHFFEHMMFQGSKNVADEQHFKLITEAGGDMNGTTNSDRTNYYQTVPANQLEKVLWLEADRMGFLLDAVTQEKFEVQRQTVKNERGQRYDNQPYGLRDERVGEALYPQNHPYSWTTIGYVEDLERVNVNDLKAFFKRWYGPNNAVLTIGGDIDKLTALQWVKQYFGSIPAGPEVDDAEKVAVTLQQDRYITLEDQVYLPLIQLTYPTVHVRHADEAPLDVLSNILGGGKTSLFYKNLVKDNYAVQAIVNHPCQELACEFQLIALANPAKTTQLGEIQSKIAQTLAEFEQRGVNQDDLDKTIASIESSTIFGLQSVSGKVSTLAANEIFNGQPDMVQYDLNRYKNVSKEDVMRVYRRYIKGKAKVVLSIVPAGQTQLAAAQQNFVLPQRVFDISSSEHSVTPVKVSDSFDRSVIPTAGPSPKVSVPQYSSKTFANGIQMLVHQTSELPTLTLLFSMEGGPLLDPIDKAGLASFTAQMMNESTTKMSNEKLANELELLGSQISFSAGGRSTQIRVTSLTDHLDETLALLKLKLFSPAFLQEDFQRIKQSHLQQLQQQIKNPNVLASRAVKQLLYGQQNRISLPDEGTLESIQNITLDDVKAFYRDYYSPSKGNMVVVGNIQAADIIDKLDFITQWQAAPYTIPEYQAFPQQGRGNIYLVDKPGATQSVVRIIERAAPYDATGEHFRSKLMNFPLGGMFNSRISLNLREDKGYTYGASSSFVGGKTLGYFQAGADVKIANTGDAIAEFLREIDQFHDQGMTEEELHMMRSAYTQSEALNYETPYSKARFLNHLLAYELDRDYREAQFELIRQIDVEELNRLAKRLLDSSEMQIVVVGDSEVVMPQLLPLGRPIIKMNISQ